MTLMPLHMKTSEGNPRRVGVEIEFGGLDPKEAAELVKETFGGWLKQLDVYRWQLSDSELGEFQIELDTKYVHKNESWIGEAVDSMNPQLGENIRMRLGEIAQPVVPTEIVSPPIDINDLRHLDRLTAKLRQAEVFDSKDNMLYAFGVHLNPEIVDTAIGHILPILKAYLLMSPWLRAEIDVDTSRRVLPHINGFSADYVSLVTDPNYQPAMSNLIDDYLAYNPTRNRELDMLPCFAWIDQNRVTSMVDDPRIKKRPAFHYRLPETKFCNENWSVMKEFERWLLVERIAEDSHALDELFEIHEGSNFISQNNNICHFVEEWRRRYSH